MPAQTIIKLRRDTDANWTSTNPTLAAGEAGFESDTGKLKIGDGSTAWTSLGYVSGGASVEVSDTPPSAPEANTLWWESDTGTLFIYYDNFWVEAVTGVVGPSGLDGADNIVTSATAPTNTDVLWIDTSEAGDAVLPLAGTTGQILQKASNADYDTEWATNPIYPLGANGSLLTSDGSTPSWLANSGTEGDILRVSATGGLEFATPASGGLTEIATTSISGDTAITGMTTTGYKKLAISVTGLTGGTRAFIGFGAGSMWNGNTTSMYKNGSSTPVLTGSETSGLSIAGNFTLTGGIQYGTFWVEMNNISTSAQRLITGSFASRNGASTTFVAEGSASISNAGAVTSAHIITQGNGTFTAGTMTVYGVN